MNVSSWSIRNPIPAILLFILLTLAGLVSFKAMKIQNFPDVDLPTVVVTAQLPGAAPAQLETDVARKIENSVATLQGVKHIYTKVQDGTATVTVEFRLEKPTQEAVDDVRDAVTRIRADLPSDLRDPIISKMDLSGLPILTYTVSSTRMDDEALSWFVDHDVAKAMLSVKGVGAVARVGGVTRQVSVELDPARLLALNATAADISRQLRQMQQEASGGRADLGGHRGCGVAMALQKPNRGVPAATRPCRGQLGNLGALHPQRFHDRRARRPQFRAVAIERAKVEALFAVVPVADPGGVRRQVPMLVAERVARRHVALGVLDGGPALGEALGDIEPVGHDQAIRAAAYSSASA